VDAAQILIFAAGVGLLIGGAWVLISGGTRAAAVLGVPPVVVGLTVVAFGTSAPELFVSLIGALRGNTGLVLGNVVGSNVANIGLILALAAVLRPVLVEKGLVRRELPLMLGASALLMWFAWDGVLDRINAAALFVVFIGFMTWTLRSSDRGADPQPELPAVDRAHRGRELALGAALVVGGVVGLAVGGQLIITSAVKMAASWGVSETLVGLTMVAVGTSLPELATTIVAAVRNQDDLALGNIVGSNLFNILGVAAPVGLMRPLVADLPTATVSGVPMTPGQVQLLSMGLLTLMICAMVWLGRGRVGRGRGLVLLGSYALIMFLWTTLDQG
jgi:cation:H+ antiporter